MAATKKTTKQPPKEEKNPLSDQLERAMMSVERNQRAALTLHFQWRTHLLRMSYVIMIITFHQAQAPTTSCIKEIKVRRRKQFGLFALLPFFNNIISLFILFF
jgi:tRNA (Thr-GGU) A37 N-methylase